MRSPRFSGLLKKRSSPLLLRRVMGESMLPGLPHGRVILAATWPRRIRSGDVVIIRHNGLEKIKRVREIGEGGIFVVGDNPAESTDSRTFGRLPPSAVIAKVIWPRASHH